MATERAVFEFEKDAEENKSSAARCGKLNRISNFVFHRTRVLWVAAQKNYAHGGFFCMKCMPCVIMRSCDCRSLCK